MVLMLHTNLYLSRSSYPLLLVVRNISGIAIPLFFSVSGYLMAGKQYESLNQSVNYSICKVLNILKVTFIVCLVFDLISYLRTGTIAFSFPLCFIQKGNWWHFWYFGTMIIIYLILPALFRFINNINLRVILLVLFGINTILWILDILLLFEKNHIIQTFRLWYFLFYFLLGWYIRNHNNSLLSIRGEYVILSAIFYAIVVQILPAGGVEYSFGSPFCVLYSFLLFLFILKKPISSKPISLIESTVLPAYILHPLIIRQIIIPVICPIIYKLTSNPILFEILIIPITVIIVLLFSKAFTFLPYYSKIFRL